MFVRSSILNKPDGTDKLTCQYHLNDFCWQRHCRGLMNGKINPKPSVQKIGNHFSLPPSKLCFSVIFYDSI